jgi:sortase (surface protein transpeptidase)
MPDPGSSAPLSPLATLLQPAGDARYDAEDHRTAPAPISIVVEEIGLAAAVVVAGLEADGALEVPAAQDVGWYGFGPSPGQRGSAVLAAHIAFDGRDGAFRHLERLSTGSTITVGFDDGSSVDFVATQRAQYGKEALPDDLFSSEGEPRLVLITCGGAFNRSLRSYEDNVVVYAEPR